MSGDRSSAPASSGMGASTVLTIVFVVLKLTHVIAWSWWWVLSPLWISAGAAIAILIVVLLIAVVASVSKQ